MLDFPEITYGDIFKCLQRRFLFIFSLALAGLSLALVICALLPERYEASVLLRVGKLGIRGPELEPPLEVVERVSSSGFSCGTNAPLQSDSEVKATVVNRSNLIRLEARAASRAQAITVVDACLRTIQTEHEKIIEGYNSYLNEQKKISYPSDLLMEGITDLKFNLVQNWAQKTVSVETIQAKADPVFPRPMMAGSISFLVGGLIGFLIALLIEILGKSRLRG